MTPKPNPGVAGGQPGTAPAQSASASAPPTQRDGTTPSAQQQAAKVLHVPAVVVVYGPSKTGKTTDQLYSFPNGLFIAEPAALKPAHQVVGWAPQAVEPASDLDDIYKVIDKHSKNGIDKHDAVIIDDFSLAAERTHYKLEKTNRGNGFAVWRKLGEKIARIILKCREIGVHVVFTCHERGPKDDMPGGPALPSKRLTQELPKHCDLVLRTAYDPIRQPWPAVYKCGLVSGGSWVTGDRHGVCQSDTPMNLAEILRKCGFQVNRPPGFEWMEKVVAHGANLILNGSNENLVLRDIGQYLRNNSVQDIYIAWAWRDIRDRVEIANGLNNRLGSFGIQL